MRWAMKQRMDFVRERLRFVGTINRRDLVEKFDMSSPQASADLKTFRRLNRGWMRYDKSKKTFVSKKPVETPTRDVVAAAKSLAAADDKWLRTVVVHDPSMIRDVAAALLYERNR